LAIRIGVDAQAIKRLESGVGSVATLTAAMAALNSQLTGIGPGRQLHEQLSNRRRKLDLSLDRVAARARLSMATIASLKRGGDSGESLMHLLSAIASNAKRCAEERAYWGAGDKEDRDSRFTSADFMDRIYTAFGQVDLDPCGQPLSPVIARRCIILDDDGDGLTDDWSGRPRAEHPARNRTIRGECHKIQF
jgi:transcriptional regulator with XRE-family HTH domain